jgi:hypothetical protein
LRLCTRTQRAMMLLLEGVVEIVKLCGLVWA